MSIYLRPDDIVGYTFRADIYCPTCVVLVLPTGPGEAFDGWAIAAGYSIATEENLNELSAAFGIDRLDESTFDSDDFPKVLFRDAADDDEMCGHCLLPLDPP